MYLSPAVSYRILTDNPGKTEALLIRPDAPPPPAPSRHSVPERLFLGAIGGWDPYK